MQWKKKKWTSLVTIFALLISIIGIFTPIQKASADTTSGLIGHWTFDGTGKDVSGNEVDLESVGSFTYEPGVHGQAAVFKGNNYFKRSNDTELNLSNNFTLSTWMYTEDMEGRIEDQEVTFLTKKGYINKDSQSVVSDYLGDAPYVFQFNYGEELYVATANQDSYESFYEYCIPAKKWTLVTITFDGTDMKFYQDGQLFSTRTNNYPPYQTNADFLLGYSAYLYELDGGERIVEQYFEGKLDDFRLYNRALTEGDVAALYQGGLTANKELLAPSDRLVAHYTFDGNLNDSAFYRLNGTSRGGNPSYITGVKGQAIELNGGTGIEVPASDALNFNQEMTFMAWIKPADGQSEAPLLARKNPTIGVEASDNTYRLVINTLDGQLMGTTEFDYMSWSIDGWNGGYQYEWIASNNDVPLSDWMHYTFTLKDGVMKVYYDGVLQSTIDGIERKTVQTASGVLRIGFDGVGKYYRGGIDDLRLYNYALTDAQIIDAMTSTPSVPTTVVDGTIYQGNTILGTGFEIFQARGLAGLNQIINQPAQYSYVVQNMRYPLVDVNMIFAQNEALSRAAVHELIRTQLAGKAQPVLP